MKRKCWMLVMASIICLSSLVGCGQEKKVELDVLVEQKQEVGPGFSIDYLEDGIKRVVDGEGRELILVPKALEEVPEVYKDSLVIRTPVENAVFLSATQICNFRNASKEILKGIGGVVGDETEWSTIPSIHEGLVDGSILSVGSDWQPDYELIQSLDPEIVFVYTGLNPQTEAIAKLEELGINYAVDNDYMEEDYISRMEWIRFIYTFFNADEDAEQMMTKATETINHIKAQIQNQEAPKVALFSVFDGIVYATSDSSWIGSMIKDMGAINVFSKMTESSLSLEEAYVAMEDADVIIYTSTPDYTNGLQGIIEECPQVVDCKAYENQRIYQYNATFWQSIDQTELVASDFAAILYPNLFKNHLFNYYIKVS